jgi:hypothetical protein
MKKHSIDNLFANKLKEAEVSPRPEAWEKLNGRIAQKNKKRILWWQQSLWMAAASVILVVGLIWFIKPTTKDNVIAQKTIIETPTKTNPMVDNTAPKLTNRAVVIEQNKTELAPKQTIVQEKTVVQPVLKMPEQPQENMVANQPETKIEQEAVAVQPITEIATKTIEKEKERVVVMELSEITEKSNDKAPVINKIEEQEVNTLFGKPTRKNTRFARVVRQLKNIKEGEKIDWNEVGFDPNPILAKAKSI